jgi:hypothetical protein
VRPPLPRSSPTRGQNTSNGGFRTKGQGRETRQVAVKTILHLRVSRFVQAQGGFCGLREKSDPHEPLEIIRCFGRNLPDSFVANAQKTFFKGLSSDYDTHRQTSNTISNKGGTLNQGLVPLSDNRWLVKHTSKIFLRWGTIRRLGFWKYREVDRGGTGVLHEGYCHVCCKTHRRNNA